MRKPINNANITLPLETHQRLTKIRDHNGWTYTRVIDKLCELEFRNNAIHYVVNYELLAYDKIFKFRVTFRADTFHIEYERNGQYTDNINEWGLNARIKNIFYEFIKKDCARCMLLYMPMGIMFEEFDIYRIG